MLSNRLIKKCCIFLTVAMISLCLIPVFADEPSGISNDADTINIQMGAYYTQNANGSYDIDFAAIAPLSKSLKGINFTIEISDTEITKYEFGEALKDSAKNTKTITNSNHTVIFGNGAPDTLVDGKVIFCNITTSSLPEVSNISINNFTALDENGSAVTAAVSVQLKTGPVVPPLTEEEKNVYDLICNLPAADSLSFGGSDVLNHVSELEKQVQTALDSYNALDSTEKTALEERMAYDSKSLDALTVLPAILTEMNKTKYVIRFAEILKVVPDSSLTGYAFITEFYNKNAASLTGDLSNNATLLGEYNTAIGVITDKDLIIKSSFENNNTFSYKYNAIRAQLDNIKTLYSDIYYKDYLSALKTSANDLIDAIELTNPDKDSPDGLLITGLEKVIEQIDVLLNMDKNLPSFSVDELRRDSTYTVLLTRAKSTSPEADISVSIYSKTDMSTAIDTKSFDFPEGETTLSAKMRAERSDFTIGSEYVITVSYTVSGIIYDIGSTTLTCLKEYSRDNYTNSIPTTPTPNTNTTDTDTSTNTTGGYIYPDVSDDDNSSNDNNDDNSFELFNDISNYAWAKESIEGLYYAGIINGMDDGGFNPAGYVTREQFCKMVVQLFGILDYENIVDSFDDVDANAWYAPYISSAIKAGYVQGQSDTYFGIGEPIMRQDMATIIYRAMGSKNSSAILDFTDADKIAPYAEEAISELVGLGIINGYEDGSLKPRGTATRAEAAKIIWGIYNIINN